MAAAASGMPAQSHLVDRPTSRLSKRITRWPRAASAAQRSSCQRIICAARPMMRSKGRPSGGPKVSYAISMPLAGAVGMRPSLAELAGAGQGLAVSSAAGCERPQGVLEAAIRRSSLDDQIGSGHNVCATHWRSHASEELVAFFPEGCATTAPPGTPMGLVAARDLETRYPARSGLVGPLPRSEERRGLCVQDGPRRRASEL